MADDFDHRAAISKVIEDVIMDRFKGRPVTLAEFKDFVRSMPTLPQFRDPVIDSIKVELDPADPTRVIVSGLPEQLIEFVVNKKPPVSGDAEG